MTDPNDRVPDPESGLVYRTPAQLRDGEIPIGWRLDAPAQVGFETPAPTRDGERQLVAFRGEGHFLTIARTGAGKGRGCSIPWLLTLPNPAIVLDVKGEAFHTTAAWRRKKLGHKILVIDPFDKVSGTDRLNPFDLVRKGHLEEDSDVLAELFLDGHQKSLVDSFWDNHARSFLHGAIAHVASAHRKPTPRHLRDLLQCDDPVMEIAKLLDAKKVKSKLAAREFATFLNHEKEKVRNSVLSTAQQHLRPLAVEASVRSLCDSTVSLDDVSRGRDFTIYLVIPPENLASHGNLLRLWVGTLLHAVTRRTRRPPHNTVFLLDEIAQCGTLPILRQAITLLRGYGMTTMTLWQDLAQMQQLYPDWPSLLNNCAVVQTFGAPNFAMSKTVGDVIGVAPERIRDLPAGHSMVSVAGAEPFAVERMDYLRDSFLRDRSGKNPWFDGPEDGADDGRATGQGM